MTADSVTCPNGHQWVESDQQKQCPVCGAEAAETLCDGQAEHGSTEYGATIPPTDAPKTSPPASGEQTQFGRYRIIGELGRGGMGIVYRAFDPVLEHEVALKTLPANSPAMLSRFKREFRVMSGLDHPNVVRFYELNSDGQTWFFTMEIVEGIDLLSYVHDGFADGPANSPRHDDETDPGLTVTLAASGMSPDQERRLSSCFGQLADAVCSLHAHGLVHRDIKPSNVVVTSGGRVVLLDLGLVAEVDESGLHQSLHQQVIGTAAYMSPEQAACDPISEASDWYSMGVILYQALTGDLPHVGRMMDILLNKQKQDPVPPRQAAASVPQDWSDLCMDLLQRDPQSRPAGAEILDRLGSQRDFVVPEGDQDGDVLIGRDSQQQSIRDCWRTVRDGQAGTVLVSGESGTGKSSLVEAFLKQAAREGAVIIRGRCYEMESVPFKAIDSLVDALVDYLQHLSSADAAALMPRDVHALVRLFPVMGQVGAIGRLPRRNIDTSDQQEFNRRAIAALRELLTRIGDRAALVVYIDDLQWGDEDSATMLSDLLQPPEPPVLLFLGTYRAEDSDTSQFLRSFRHVQRQREFPIEPIEVVTGPLEIADATQLALSLLANYEDGSQETAESIARESAGNPFFVSELVKYRQLDDADTFVEGETPRLFNMVWSRVSRLPDECQDLLAVVALAGQPLPLDQAIRIADVAQSAVNALRSEHLIRTIGQASSPRIETYHDRVRESVSSCMGLAARRRHHQSIAEEFVRQLSLDVSQVMEFVLEADGTGLTHVGDEIAVDANWYEIAYQYDAAARPDLAFPFALATAERSRAQFSLEVAEQQYRIAEQYAETLGDAVRYRVAEGLGDVLMLRGEYAESERRLHLARELASEADVPARIVGKSGELAFKRGDNAAGIAAVEDSLRLLGRRVPSNPLSVFAFLAREVAVQTLHTLFPKVFLASRKLDGAENELLAVDMYVHLSRVYFFERGKIPCLWAHLRSFNLGEKYPPTRELATAWASHAPIMSLVPWFSRGETYVRKALEIQKARGDVCGQGQALHYLGVLQFASTRYDDCIATCTESVRLLERSGDYWERNVACYSKVNAILRKGDLASAVSEARRLYDVSTEIGDDKSAGFALEIWARASVGDVPEDIMHRELQKDRNDLWATVLVILAEAMRLLRNNEHDEAIDLLQQAYNRCRKGGMNPWVLPIVPWTATACREQWQRTPEANSSRRRQLLQSARTAVRRAVSAAKTFRSDLPHALRESALLAEIDGRQTKARRLFEQSLQVAEAQGAMYEAALTRMHRAEVGGRLGWGFTETEIDQTRREVERFEKLGTE